MVKGFLKDDVIIMCTDGLTNLVEAQTLLKFSKETLEYMPKKLVNEANKKGGYDNITVVVIKNI